MSLNTIRIRGAKTHNLKQVNLDLPRDKLVVITGLSGSGKSSLAFDTLYAEGQRRYVESLSAYARQFLSVMEKPDVDLIEGLSPAIAIQQKATSHNPRSTVGTVTEIYDYLRLLFARVGEPRCPVHGLSLAARTVSQMVDEVLALPLDSKAMILAPLVSDRKGEYSGLLKDLQSKGYVRARIDGEIYELDSPPTLVLRQKHTIEVVIDRFRVKPEWSQRLSESFENALRLSGGLVVVASMEGAFPEQLFSSKFACATCGYNLAELEPRIFSFNSPAGACPMCDGLGVLSYHDNSPCRACNGTRLKESARHVFVGGHTLPEFASWPIEQLETFFKTLHLEGHQEEIAQKINQEIIARLGFLVHVGLNYLSLSRAADTLSGGEAQRIRLASQIGSGLVGVMYILDEPSIGLHQRDNDRLLQSLLRLRDLGNTVIVVEHDEDAILAADFVVDMGPMAGVHGGQVVAAGTPADIKAHATSLTGRYLSGQENIEVPAVRVPFNSDYVFTLKGVSCNNLQGVDVTIPLGLMVCVTGVSGSGKSSLVNDTLYPIAMNALHHQADRPLIGAVQSMAGLQHCNKIIAIDQSPIGRTPRSNPATYTGVFTHIRTLFAGTPEARARGYEVGRFSFNVKGGRCEVCEGDGLIKVEMHFLPDLYVMCDTCQGRRYNRETLEIHYKGKTIHDVLDMTVEEARVFFTAIPSIAQVCQTLIDVGLSYLRLGQSATTLSGGEAQRIKLARELSKRDTGKTLYILDEPTTGLHFYDVRQLLAVLIRLRNQGNTILIVEHHLDVIKTADWIIDLGPEGGNAGGQIIATGTPEMVAENVHSYTGHFLKRHLKINSTKHD